MLAPQDRTRAFGTQRIPVPTLSATIRLWGRRTPGASQLRRAPTSEAARHHPTLDQPPLGQPGKELQPVQFPHGQPEHVPDGATTGGSRRTFALGAYRPTSDKIRYVNFCLALLAGLLVPGGTALAAQDTRDAPPPSVVFLLLDTTRADRLGAWGGPNATSPILDALAADGVRFARHFANSHATRPSMPQLMSGRYYHQNILRTFRPNDHPREFPFSRPDPTAILLPAILHRAGFRTLAVSAHPWVSRESQFGAGFDAFELLEAPAERGHAAADRITERAIALWQNRDRSRPTFLYVHFMDAHMPRFLPPGGLRFGVPGFDWEDRFRPDGEAAFDRARRAWRRTDARDFTSDDRRHFAAVYDTLLAWLDAQIGRLLAVVRTDDPRLERTLIVVTADHGEELGEGGRIDHGDSLGDGVQHVPWIMAGAGIRSGHVVRRFSEHVDVVPTVLERLGIPLPPGTHVDGRAQLASDGGPCEGCAKTAAYFAWEDYRGIRRRRHLLRRNVAGSLRGRCEGEIAALLVAPNGDRNPMSPGGPVPAALSRRLDHRLDHLERAFRGMRYGPADRPVVLRSEFWRLDDPVDLACVPLDGETPRSALHRTGWLATGRGPTLLDLRGATELTARFDVPDGRYHVELLTVVIPRMPRLFGFTAWRKAGFMHDHPVAAVPAGSGEATGGSLAVKIAAEGSTGRRVFAVRVVPEGAAPSEPAAPDDPEQIRRLRALGYIQ